jgi:hypothetical protein
VNLRAQARHRLARELRRLAGTLTRWAADTDDGGDDAAPPPPDTDRGREHWLATVREHAPELLAGGGMGYSLDPGPRAWRPNPDPAGQPGGPAPGGTGYGNASGHGGPAEASGTGKAGGHGGPGGPGHDGGTSAAGGHGSPGGPRGPGEAGGTGNAGGHGSPGGAGHDGVGAAGGSGHGSADWPERGGPGGPDGLRHGDAGPGEPHDLSAPAGIDRSARSAAISPASDPDVPRGVPGDGGLAAGGVAAGAGPAPGGAAARPAARPTPSSEPALAGSTPPGPPVHSTGAEALDVGEPVASRPAGDLVWPMPAARTSGAAPDLVIAAPALRPMPSLVAMTVPDGVPGAPAAEPASTGFPATPAPWPALAADPERAPVEHAPPTGRWPELPDDGEQRAWAPGLAHRDGDRDRRLAREQRGIR